MGVEENKILVQRLYDDLFNRRQLGLVDDLIAAGAAYADERGEPEAGPEGARRLIGALTRAFPDHRHLIEDLIAEEDRVVARVTFSGTQRGAYLGIAPTGRRISQRQIHICRCAGGKVVEHWEVRDDLEVLRQLGGRVL